MKLGEPTLIHNRAGSVLTARSDLRLPLQVSVCVLDGYFELPLVFCKPEEKFNKFSSCSDEKQQLEGKRVESFKIKIQSQLKNIFLINDLLSATSEQEEAAAAAPTSFFMLQVLPSVKDTLST